MKTTSPILATVVFGAGAALLVAAVASLPLRRVAPSTLLNVAMFLCLAAYAALLARLSGRSCQGLPAPLLTLAAVLPVAASVGGFVVPAAACLAWIRSGICFPGPPARRVIAETLITGTGLALCAGLRPPGWAGWALGLWMFFLVQALYFALVDPVQAPRGDCPGREVNETAHRRAQALLREEKLERAFAELQLSARRGSDTC